MTLSRFCADSHPQEKSSDSHSGNPWRYAPPGSGLSGTFLPSRHFSMKGAANMTTMIQQPDSIARFIDALLWRA
jgi:hypothetical protein